MIKLTRHPQNPIFIPSENNLWEKEAVFNCCVVKENDEFHMIYRAMSSSQLRRGAELELSTIGHAVSNNGVDFTQRRQLIRPEYDWEAFGCEDPRVTKIDGKYYIFYTILSTHPFSPAGIKIGVAITQDFKTIKERHQVTTFNSKAMSLFPERINGKLVGILTVNTDIPPAKIALAFFDDESQIWSKEYWHDWFASLDTHVVPLMRAHNDQVEIGASPVKTKHGWLLIHSYIKDYLDPTKRIFGVEAVLLDLADPSKVVARTSQSIFAPQKDYELYGKVPHVVFPSGALIQDEKLFIYYGAADTTCCLATCQLSELLDEMKIKTPADIIKSDQPEKILKRFNENPIISPISEHAWESKAVFNPAAIYEDGKIHIVYRAMSEDNTSVFGYAVSHDGFHIEERLIKPIYTPREEFEKKIRPGNSGCEDPRITKIGNTLYMCYTAFDGVNSPRVALTSISVSDFLSRNWNWKKTILISPPGVDDKNACILPKKINGQYIIFHRMNNHICINLVDDLKFGEDKWLEVNPLIEPRADKWDNLKVGISAPPVETKDGWLLLYHGVSDPDGIYRIGATLLGLDDPTQVLARTNLPILEPIMKYELEGQVPNVVFPCGAVVKDDQLFIYYGGGDTVVGVATTSLNKILKEVRKNE